MPRLLLCLDAERFQSVFSMPHEEDVMAVPGRRGPEPECCPLAPHSENKQVACQSMMERRDTRIRMCQPGAAGQVVLCHMRVESDP
jgi:hypothetical protein